MQGNITTSHVEASEFLFKQYLLGKNVTTPGVTRSNKVLGKFNIVETQPFAN